MKILVACEYSGKVREAFRKLGHDAWSCDLLPADDASPYHIQGDVLEVFAEHGPTNQELEAARDRMAEVSDRALSGAGFWSYRLSMDAQGDQPLDGLLSMARDYAGVTAVECREIVAEALSGSRISIHAAPPESRSAP